MATAPFLAALGSTDSSPSDIPPQPDLPTAGRERDVLGRLTAGQSIGLIPTERSGSRRSEFID